MCRLHFDKTKKEKEIYYYLKVIEIFRYVLKVELFASKSLTHPDIILCMRYSRDLVFFFFLAYR